MDTAYTTVEVNGYHGRVTHRGTIAEYQTGKGGSMPNAAELRRFAGFLLELAETAERLKDQNGA